MESVTANEVLLYVLRFTTGTIWTTTKKVGWKKKSFSERHRTRVSLLAELNKLYGEKKEGNNSNTGLLNEGLIVLSKVREYFLPSRRYRVHHTSRPASCQARRNEQASLLGYGCIVDCRCAEQSWMTGSVARSNHIADMERSELSSQSRPVVEAVPPARCRGQFSRCHPT